ncbi:uncharacterized protein PAC_11639 [Phialocephala subalpina]|uniref:C2H2-type domain-containing protein n=1 Tax=Phialocephala subalpina TaxID=576137 RepID=A0A1L7X9Q3_9HELO|nr:uncharacterized protein PAC_11639 [Phialocephala subalpina]
MCRRAIDGHAAASYPSHPSHSSLRLEGAVGERPWRGSVRSRMRNDNTTLYSSSRTLDQPRFVGRSTLDTDYTFRDHPLYQYVTSKADGLYHCPWEGDERCQHRPEKLKANYDKFVDSHLKPYRCKVVACKNSKFLSTACLLRHEREAHAMHGHGDKPHLCTYVGCGRGITGNRFPRHRNLRDHMKRYHNDPGTSSKHRLPSDGDSTQLINRGKKRKPEELLAPRANRSANADITTHAQERSAFDRYLQN